MPGSPFNEARPEERDETNIVNKLMTKLLQVVVGREEYRAGEIDVGERPLQGLPRICHGDCQGLAAARSTDGPGDAVGNQFAVPAQVQTILDALDGLTECSGQRAPSNSPRNNPTEGMVWRSSPSLLSLGEHSLGRVPS